MTEEKRQSLVFIPNKSAHDFSPAEKYGRLIYLTDGPVQRLSVDLLYKTIEAKLRAASAEDHLMVASLNIISAIASGYMGHKFGRVNFLLWYGNAYVERIVHFR